MKPDKPLPGSTKSLLIGARAVGDVDPEHLMSVTVVVRPKTPITIEGAPLSREEFAVRHGADPDDVRRVEEYAATHHLTAAEVNLATRTIVLRGRTADMQAAFGVTFKLYATEDNQRFRGREGDVYIPHQLQSIIEAVLGLDDRPVAKPHLRRIAAAVAARAFNSPDVAKLYDFPLQLDGSGQCLAIIELGGGYRLTDMKKYFASVKKAVPTIVAVGVNGGSNSPGVDNGADGEVALDIEVAGAIAAKAKIAVYFAPNTDAGFLNAIKTAVHDSVRAPSVVSISWGGPESQWTAASMQQFDVAFQEAAAVGVTVLAASGDSGSSDGVQDGKPHVDFPASSPHVVACGGTRVVASGAKIATETVWNDGPNGPGAGGGGVSAAFAKPDFQSKVSVPKPVAKSGGRGVPDVSGNADPVTGYNVFVDGSKAVIGGTSAVAPLYAALVILLNQARKSAGKTAAGFILPALYSTAGLCRDVTSDNNDYSGTLGVYKAGAGWDPCSGLGSAIGSKWLAAFAAPARSAVRSSVKHSESERE